MRSSFRKQLPVRGKPAFTLAEMLVVIAIITILMTAGSIGINSAGGKGVTSGVATAEALFDEARSTAIGKNTRSAVLIAKELTNQPEDNLKKVIIATAAAGSGGSSVTWEFSSRGSKLGDRVYFSEKFSKKNHDSGTGDIDVVTISGNNKPSLEGDYYIYQFNSEGIPIDKGASFVIGSGAKPASSDTPVVTSEGRRDFGGFVIWRNGSTSVFRSPEQIFGQNGPDTGEEF